MTDKKYELINDPNAPDGLHRIRALRDIPRYGVKTGDLGGFIQSEVNLSHAGDAWVEGNARVHDRAIVYDDARISGEALIGQYARVSGGAIVSGNANVCDSAKVFDVARVSDNAEVLDNAEIFENACVSGNATIYDRAHVGGDVRINNCMYIAGDARLYRQGHLLTVVIQASDFFDATLHPTADGHRLAVGCWEGTVDEFEAMIRSDEWVEATPEQITDSREEMLAFISLVRARMRRWGGKA